MISFTFILFTFVHVALSDNSPAVKKYSYKDLRNNIPDKCHFVLYYVPWCEHCRAFLPVWKNIAMQTQENGLTDASFAEVDCTDPINKLLICNTQGVKSFPTIMWYPKGSYRGYIYKGLRRELYLTNVIEQVCPRARLF